MSAISDITVFDGAATPVSHVLKAISVTRDKSKVIAQYRESVAGIPVSAQVQAVLSIEQLKSGVYKVDAQVDVPVMESISGNNASGYTAAPKVAYVNSMRTTGFFHERSDVTGRRLVRQMSTNLFGNISTSVTPVSTGPFPELFDQLISPT